ncbi:conserved Plasmodium protein, unknown function [Plasmodium malariae]|uniref:Uncharacterized protein n=2 Tax=Plasmodium malariae TaxID=5858 RepID=A0A1D3PCA7_PLAMA|nr:conserved Plasmodium protein, unknown function [Plasmodium malariae]SCN12678.1 conserved Plasmodium protein, unknown function [Plasmodium malariae]
MMENSNYINRGNFDGRSLNKRNRRRNRNKPNKEEKIYIPKSSITSNYDSGRANDLTRKLNGVNLMNEKIETTTHPGSNRENTIVSSTTDGIGGIVSSENVSSENVSSENVRGGNGSGGSNCGRYNGSLVVDKGSEDEKDTVIKTNNSHNIINGQEENIEGKEKNYLNNGELVEEPLEFEEKLKMWKGTVNSIKEKREDEIKLQQQRQLNVENIKLAHTLNKEEKISEKMYLEQLKKDEELAKQIELELNKDIRNELSLMEQEDFKLATIIQNSFESEQSTTCGDDNYKKKSKTKLFTEKLKSFFRRKSSANN